MAKEETKDFNAMLHRDTDMPKIQIITDPAVIQKYGGEKMYFAPPLVYDEIMRSVPRGKLLTVGHIRAHLAKEKRGGLYRPHHSGDLRFHSSLGQPPAAGEQNALLADVESRWRTQRQLSGRP